MAGGFGYGCGLGWTGRGCGLQARCGIGDGSLCLTELGDHDRKRLGDSGGCRLCAGWCDGDRIGGASNLVCDGNLIKSRSAWSPRLLDLSCNQKRCPVEIEGWDSFLDLLERK